ncbi:pheST operon leader peptide PheM [Dickeya zeae]|nr:pheST operon leader peptide PheM [Dickeya zeae]UPT55914.1 pheST operon leader peptide PheM [Dickeya zeae]
MKDFQNERNWYIVNSLESNNASAMTAKGNASMNAAIFRFFFYFSA